MSAPSRPEASVLLPSGSNNFKASERDLESTLEIPAHAAASSIGIRFASSTANRARSAAVDKDISEVALAAIAKDFLQVMSHILLQGFPINRSDQPFGKAGWERKTGIVHPNDVPHKPNES
jgi:hypothetical protein